VAASVLMFAVVPFDLGEMQVRAWIADPALQAALVQVFNALDGTWITLAAINTYFFLAQAEGIATTRRWFLLILLGTGAAAWIGARTGFPFGPIAFTEKLGMRIGRVLPFSLPLLWFTVLLNARYFALRLFPRISHWQLALATAALALFTDMNLEPVAWKMRAYWIWYPLALSAPAFPPVQNYVSWFVLAFVLAGSLRETSVVVMRRGSSRRPMAIFLLVNTVFLAANTVRLLRSV